MGFDKEINKNGIETVKLTWIYSIIKYFDALEDFETYNFKIFIDLKFININNIIYLFDFYIYYFVLLILS
jgi:hypothetical protein